MRQDMRFDGALREHGDEDVAIPEWRGAPGRYRFVMRAACAAAVIGGLTVAAREQKTTPEIARWEDPPAARTIVRPANAETAITPLLRLSADASDPLARAEPPRWNTGTGLREDSVSSGGFDTIEAPFLRITMSEAADRTGAPTTLFVTLARRAAEVRGLSVLRTGLRGQIETKFGPFEIVDTVLSGDGTRACTGFQSLPTHDVRIDGWLCGILGQPPEPRAVACAIDRLTLSGPASPVLQAAFAAAEQRHGTDCTSVVEESAQVTGSVHITETSRNAGKNEAQMRRIVQAEH